jgi:tetratricopeptide (TPR) repeat protein
MRFALALLLAGMVPIPAVAQSQPVAAPDPEVALADKVRAALELLHAKKPSEALALLDPALGGYEALYAPSRGKIRCTSDDAAQGKRQGDVTLIANGFCFALWAKAFVLVDLQRFDEAVAPATRATVLMPDHAQFHSELGYIHQTLKHYDLSLAAYAQAARVAASIKNEKDRKFDLRRAWFGMAYDYIELGRLDEAETYLNKALEVAPGDQKLLDELQYVRDLKAKRKSR